MGASPEDNRRERQPPSSGAPQAPIEERLAREAARAKLFGAPAQRLGRYTVLEVLGSGAMGTVYAAYDPKLDRRVALKLVRQQDAEQDARLVREAQAMAQLSHPNIVQVYDVGNVEGDGTNVVYIAMEFVDGTTLRRWLDDRERSGDEILEVFGGIGQGLAAAHHAGLVHRDFKPDNVLVAHDGRPRVVDFGLVRRGGAPGDEAQRESTLPGSAREEITRTGTVMGTPAYMAPEQYAGAAVDARSDQFAFCVALHEALLGVRPFAGDSIPELADNVMEGRRTTPESPRPLALHVRRVIDRGLQRAPLDRFPTMDVLLTELRHRPRWRPVAAAAGVGGVALAAFAIIPGEDAPCPTTDAAANELFTDAQRETVRAGLAATELGFSERTADVVITQLDEYAQRWAHSRVDACTQARVHGSQSEALMDRRIACLRRREQELAAAVKVLSHADETVAGRATQVAAGLPLPNRCDDTDALLADVPPPDATIAVEVEAQRAALAEARAVLVAGKADEASAALDAALARARELAYAPLLAEALNHASGHPNARKQPHVAEAHAIEAFNVALGAGYDREVSAAAAHLVQIVGIDGTRYSEAERWLGHAEAVSQRLSDRVNESRLLQRKGGLRFRQGRLDEAAQLMRSSCETATEAVGDEHHDVLSCWRNLAVVENARGNGDEARELIETTLEVTLRRLGPDHPDVAATYLRLGSIAAARGDAQASLEHSREALRVFATAYGPEHPTVADALYNIGNRLRERGEDALARDHYERASAIWSKAYGADSREAGGALNNIALTYQNESRFEEALETYAQAAARLENAEGAMAADAGITFNNMGNISMELGRPKEAIPQYERSLEILERTLGPDHPHIGSPLSGLGDALVELEDYSAAITHYERAVKIRIKHDAPELDQTRRALADALDDAGRPQEAMAQRAAIRDDDDQ